MTDRGLRLLLVCSNGGHLAQLHRLAPWWSRHDRLWVTFDKTDAQHLLANEQVRWGHYPTTRNVPNLLRNLVLAVRVMFSYRPHVVVSTGAGVALPFFLLSRITRAKTVYLEVFDRIDSTTLTGRLCAPFTDLFALQWEEQKAVYPKGVVVGPVYELAAPAGEVTPVEPGRPLVFVTAGTDVHPFPRLVDWVDRWRETDEGRAVDCVVQYGTSAPPAHADGHELLPLDAMYDLMRRATVVVAQGGPGGILDSRENGKLPIVVPRRHDLGEHVDDHQQAFTARLHKDGSIRRVDTEEQFRTALRDALADPASVRLPRGAQQVPPAVEQIAERVDRLR